MEKNWMEQLEEGLVFTLPLMVMDATMTKSTNTVKATDLQAPVNQLFHALALADASFTDVVTPNVDTIYSQAFLDLSLDSVVLTLPRTDRFCTVEVLDGWTNCIAVLDTAQLRNDSQQFLFTGPDFTGQAPQGMEEVKSPTPMVWVLIRTLCGGPNDMDQVGAIQAGMDACTLTRYQNGTQGIRPDGTFGPAKEFVPVRRVMGMSLEEYFTHANRLMAKNPPAPEDAPVLEKLAQIGVGPGLTFDPSFFGDQAEQLWMMVKAGLMDVDKSLARAASYLVQSGGWLYFGKPIAEFGTAYFYRAVIALVGFGANPVSIAVYPKTDLDARGGRLHGANRYVLHFDQGGLPPVKEFGFWSVTAYDSATNLLIDNPLDRYCINDRSEVTYNEDGSLDILIQQEAPEEDRRSNWLPVNGDLFHLVMRIYLPDDAVLENAWKTPTVLPL